jgi:transposase-like protein
MVGPYDENRGTLKLEILARVEAGATLRAVCAEPGMPCERTVRTWRRTDQWFAGELPEALRKGAWRRRWRYDPVRGEAFLSRYRTGEPMDAILRDPAMISRKVLAYWRLTHAPFGEEILRLKAVHEDRRLSGLRRTQTPTPWDARAADRVLYRVGQGQNLRTLHKADPTLPRPGVVARWRRERPEFDWEMRVNVAAGRRKQTTSRRRAADLADAVTDRIVQGESLASLSKEPGMPAAGTFYRWVRDHPGFAAEVARACDLREDWYTDQMAHVLERGLGEPMRELRKRMAPFSRQLVRLKHRPGTKRRRGRRVGS